MIRFLLAFMLPTALMAAEAQLMVAPRIVTTDEKGTYYSEELTNFYGTNCYLLQSSVILQRVAKNAALPVDRYKVEARRIPDTSIISVAVTGAAEDQNSRFLDALIREFFSYRQELRENIYKEKLQHLEEALNLARDSEIQERLRQAINLVKTSYASDDGENFKRIK